MNDFPSGGILGHQTLKELIINNLLRIKRKSIFQSYEDLYKNDLIDETSINLHIGVLYKISDKIKAFDSQAKYDIDDIYLKIKIDDNDGFILKPNDLLLGKTCEEITTPKNAVGFITERRTSAGNLGIVIKGFIPPGLESEQVRFTIQNIGIRPVQVYIAKSSPMKVIFHSLSSEEEYRKNRIARVSQDQIYSSGEGNKNSGRANLVISEISHEKQVYYNKPFTINFKLDNISNYEIEKIDVYPLLSEESFGIISCSPGWKLNRVTLEKTKNLFRKKKSIAKTIQNRTRLAIDDVLEGSFDMVINSGKDIAQFKVSINCFSDSGMKIPVNISSLSSKLSIKKNDKNFGNVLKRYIITAFLAAIIYAFFKEYGDPISEFVKTVIENFFKMI